MATPEDISSDSSFGSRVRSAVIWRSGTQILGQIVSWGSTLVILRILDPSDYGLFAMTQVVLAFLTFMNGYFFASSLIQADTIDKQQIRQAFGILLLINVGLALLQQVIAPFAANYYGQPMVEQLLRWQSLIYLSTPFLVIPQVVLSRDLEFKRPALVNLFSTLIGAGIGLAAALSDWGVWTLVIAPVAGFWSRAIALTILTKMYIWPSFDFRGAGHMVKFGSTLLVAHGFWIVQSQADIFIAGRVLSAHELGLYAEALFLAQVFAARFVPPLNEVAFPAYSKLQHDPSAFSYSFLKAARLVMLIACPLYIGMALTAKPLVATLLGEKWLEMTPFIVIFAIAMPMMTLQVLFSPAINAIGKPRITAEISAVGAVVMPLAFLIGVRFGADGLAWGWVAAYPPLLAFTVIRTCKHIGVGGALLWRATWPGLSTAAAMGLIVWGLDRILPPMPAPAQLAILTITGGLAYIALLFLAARDTWDELIRLVIKRKPPLAEPILSE